eukprot:1762503-Rhodomonas_salina.1
MLLPGCYFTNIASRYKHQNDALESDNVDANKPEGHVPATANGDGGDEGDVSNGAGVSSYAIVLCVRYAVCGTDVGDAATR